MELRELQADPAARLRMPEAVELGHNARDRRLTVEGSANAFDAYSFGTHASPEEVLAFYERELVRLGWTQDDGAVSKSTTDLRVDGWCKPRVAFRLAVVDPRQFRPVLDRDGRPYRTLFDAGLAAMSPEERCRER